MSLDKVLNNLAIKMETPDAEIPDNLSEDLLLKFETAGIMTNNGIFSHDNLFIENGEEDNEADDIIILHMDIRENLSKLRTLLEQKIGLNLKDYKFWLQDAQELEPHKNLVDQCVKGEGLVQINAQIQTISGRINIVDVLKPTEAALAALGGPDDLQNNHQIQDENDDTITSTIDEQSNSNIQSGEEEQQQQQQPEPQQQQQEKRKPPAHVANWVLDTKFKREQARLKIPEDPNAWSHAQVRHWLQWAVRQFNLTQIKLSDWNVNGKELCEITLEDFQKKVHQDPGNVFWTHLELLRKCKFVAIIHKALEKSGGANDENSTMLKRSAPKLIKKPIQSFIKQYTGSFGQLEVNGNRSGNNGQIQLWQFLLDILTDKDYKGIIQWIGAEGEFKLIDPERVAQLWGERKNKPAMNYEKLSRALRYYYDGDMISKVHGMRFVYKFVCDLKQLIGYDAKELAELVNQCESNSYYNDFVY